MERDSERVGDRDGDDNVAGYGGGDSGGDGDVASDGDNVGGDGALSKTRRKEMMHELQSLGARLVELQPAKLASLNLPERLHEAVLLAQRIRAREGRRRQMQFIGRLMRDADAHAIRAALADDGEAHQREVAAMHAAERWRDGLIDGSMDTTALFDRYPQAAGQPWMQMISSARREAAQGSAPKHARLLYRHLHQLFVDSEI